MNAPVDFKSLSPWWWGPNFNILQLLLVLSGSEKPRALKGQRSMALRSSRQEKIWKLANEHTVSPSVSQESAVQQELGRATENVPGQGEWPVKAERRVGSRALAQHCLQH